MAVAFDAVGPSSSGFVNTATPTATPQTWTHVVSASATALIVWVAVDNTTGGAPVISCTAGGTSMAAYSGNPVVNVNTATGVSYAFTLLNPPTGSITISVAITNVGQDAITGGSMSFTGAGGFGTPVVVTSNTGASITLTPTGVAASSMVAGFIGIGDPPVNPTTGTSRFQATGLGGSGASNANAEGATNTGTGSVSVAWTTLPSGDSNCGWAVEVQAAGSGPAPPPPPVPLPQLPPGWFPGADRVTTEPGGIPFYAQPPPVPDPGATAVPPPFPPWPPQPLPQLPPGWFPGADQVTTEPGGIPFLPQPAPVPDPGAVPVPPPPPPYPPYAPVAPYWFPGANPVVADPDGIPFYLQPQPDSSPALASPPIPPYIAGVSADGTYLIDQHGQPKLFVCEDIWAICANAGRYNSGNFQAAYDTYFTQRNNQGYSAAEVSLMSSGDPNDNFPFTTGQDWDGSWPFNGSADPTTAPNPVFWARRDYMFNSALQRGITVVPNFPGVGPSAVGASWTTAQWTAYGTFLGNRYKNQPNIIWIAGDGTFGAYAAGVASWLTALRATGDTHIFTYQNGDETSSRVGFGSNNVGADPETIDVSAQMDWVYTYNVSYPGVIAAITNEPSASDVVQGRIPVVWGDGDYLGASTTGGQTDVHLEQNLIWWALTSGACGFSTGDNAIITWDASSPGLVTSKTFYSAVIPAITTYFESLAGWQKLRPDINNSLVTSGRNSQTAPISTSGSPYTSNTDNYVTAAFTADGSLAVIYCAAAFTITINQNVMGAGYTATWVDPATCATTPTTTGSTYSSSGLGNNSTGFADWVLVLQGPPVAIAPPGIPDYLPLPPGWFPGADRVTAPPAGIPFYPLLQPTDQNAAAAAPSVTASAGLATGTGAALSTGIEVDAASTGLVTGTGAAQSPQSGIGPNAAVAAGTGTSQAPPAGIGANAGLASGTGTAQSALAGAGAAAGSAAGTGTAQPATAAIGVNDTAGPAPGTGTAQSPATSVTSPLLPPAPVIPLAPGWFPGADAIITEPGGIPFLAQPAPADPGASLTTAGTAPAQLAAGTGTAQSPLAAVGANSALAAGTGAALSAGIEVDAASTGLVTGTGAAQSPQSGIGAQAGLATGTGTAPSPQAAVGANDTAGPAPGTGTAQQPSVATSSSAPVPPGIPDYIPLPPGWFPGADAVVATPVGIPFWPLLQPADPSQSIVVTGESSPTLETFQFGSFPQIPPGSVITSVTVVINQWATAATMAGFSFGLYDSGGNPLGTATGSPSVSPDHEDQATFTGISYAQLAGLRVRTTANSGTAASGTATGQVGWVSLVVTFTPALNATATPAVLGASFAQPIVAVSAGETAPPGTLNATVSFPAATAGLIAASVLPAVLNATATFPAVAVATGQTASPGTLSATFGQPAATAGLIAASVQASVLNATAAFPAAAASGVITASAAPATLNAVFSQPAATAGLIAASGSPAVLNAALAFPPVTASGVVNATMTPAALAVSAAVPACLVIAASTGPDYAGNADVLTGTGTGSWVNPAGVIGTPDYAQAPDASWTVP